MLVTVSRNRAPVRVINHARVINALIPTPALLLLANSAVRQFSSTAGVVNEGDVVLLKRVTQKDSQIFTKPLKHGRKAQTHFGDVHHSEIIGKEYRDIVKSTIGSLLRIHQPTLAEYVTLTPRNVTPVYPDDANLIVSLLDIHITPRSGLCSDKTPEVQILEAGTGHGSLTLHLARAIHAANQSPAVAWDETTDEGKKAKREWKNHRRAVIHTIDRSQVYSNRAENVVAGFRNGLYAGHVDFHVGDVSDFISSRIDSAGTEQVFSHAILDLPDVQLHLPTAAKALQDDGLLLVFCPSISQVASCVNVVREQHLPLEQVQVLELGSGYSGGKQWDVRAVKLRGSERGETKSIHTIAPETDEHGLMAKMFASLAKYLSPPSPDPQPSPPERWEMVCRPSVGHRVVGGGFVGMWRRKKIDKKPM